MPTAVEVNRESLEDFQELAYFFFREEQRGLGLQVVEGAVAVAHKMGQDRGDRWVMNWMDDFDPEEYEGLEGALFAAQFSYSEAGWDTYYDIAYNRLMAERYADAQPIFAALKEDQKDSGDLWNNLGWCYYQLGEVDEAIECFKEGADLGHEAAATNLASLSRGNFK